MCVCVCVCVCAREPVSVLLDIMLHQVGVVICTEGPGAAERRGAGEMLLNQSV